MPPSPMQLLCIYYLGAIPSMVLYLVLYLPVAFYIYKCVCVTIVYLVKYTNLCINIHSLCIITCNTQIDLKKLLN